METVNQIYQVVNSIAKEAFGDSVATVKDTASFVALGNTVLSSTANKDAYFGILVDRIGRTIVSNRVKEPRKSRVTRNEMEWGIILQKISFKVKEAVSNPEWVNNTQASPYDIESQTEIVQKLFTVMSTYDYEDSFPITQLNMSFTNEATHAAFMAGLYANMENDINTAEDNLVNLTVNTCMAGALIKGTKAQVRHLVTEYNAAHETSIPAGTLDNADLFKYVTSEIATTVKLMGERTALFNADGLVRHTPREYMEIEMLAPFASKFDVYLQADTFHNEITKLPGYSEVNYWQAPSDKTKIPSFEDASTIDIQNINLATEQNATGTVKQSNIICFIHDIEACAAIINKPERGSLVNDYAKRVNVWAHANKGFMVDTSENAVVFMLD